MIYYLTVTESGNKLGKESTDIQCRFILKCLSDKPHDIPACLLQTHADSWSIAKTGPHKS